VPHAIFASNRTDGESVVVGNRSSATKRMQAAVKHRRRRVKPNTVDYRL